ncbi:nucleosome assembly protein 1-like 1 isoform X2 [Folsomia candida]|uniref:Nucleosome assembly protein 1-like 4 n=1 Tax=Folsomia candida TaxID=158441 RepID=A0A226F645_FOLCA|nr:nucleosome assembly protein 1-like 1 isoform X2 [Folsomia candida]OXA64918.1 Nucleosome assembly protein 1-like 4 [Folsomia candida]
MDMLGDGVDVADKAPDVDVDVKKDTIEVDSVVKAVDNLALSDDESGDENAEKEGAYLEMCPEVQKRVQALRKNQKDILQVESNFYKEIHQLELKFEKLYHEKFDFRKSIITGSHEPTNDECDFPLGRNVDEPLSAVQDTQGKEKKEGFITGIPTFWATILQTVQPICTLVEEQDIPVLAHLMDIRCENTSEPLGFKLFFGFSPNEFFENDVLVKTYVLKNDPDPESPLTYDGPEIISCEGCTIRWKEGKDTTISVVEKKQKHKKTGTIRTITKTLKRDSFFRFFSPPDPADQTKEGTNEDEEDDIIDTLNLDFEIGQALRERIIPRAVLFFTGEALEDDDDENDTDYATDSEDDEGEAAESVDDDVDEQGDQRTSH